MTDAEHPAFSLAMSCEHLESYAAFQDAMQINCSPWSSPGVCMAFVAPAVTLMTLALLLIDSADAHQSMLL